MNRNHIDKLTRMTALCLCIGLYSGTTTIAADIPANARKIMEDVYRQDTSNDITMRASFQIYDKQGHSSKKNFTYRRIGSPGDGRTLVVFTAPVEIKGVTLLSINQHGGSSRQYLYTPATRRVRSIGTDFTFEDIADRVLDDFDYRVIDDKEVMEGHRTFKISATPVDPQRSQYKYVYYWVAQDAPQILHAEMYDAQGHEVRILHASQIKHVMGIWGARHTEMRTLQDGTRTVFSIDEVKFNTHLDENLFTPEGIVEPRSPSAHK